MLTGHRPPPFDELLTDREVARMQARFWLLDRDLLRYGALFLALIVTVILGLSDHWHPFMLLWDGCGCGIATGLLTHRVGVLADASI